MHGLRDIERRTADEMNRVLAGARDRLVIGASFAVFYLHSITLVFGIKTYGKVLFGSDWRRGGWVLFLAKKRAKMKVFSEPKFLGRIL